ncbi:MAG: permease-like cell division protein FtsX [Oscillospiraceae bacterium]|nr:permease-like cell division protein FtsX [Oscillospiraceae bacterium]
MRLSRSGYLIREGFRSIGTHGFMSFASVTIIMACLIIMGSVSLLTLNIDAMIQKMEDKNQVVAFVDEAYTEEEARAIEPKLAAIPNVSNVQFVSRKEAMDVFMSSYSEDLMEGVDETWFRHRYVLQLDDIALMSQTKAGLSATEGIAKVNANLEYAKTFVTIRNVVSVIALVLIAILVFISIFIMSNTIKLATFNRREEIAIMKMVGATNSFIRLPFVVEGLVLGILGGGLAFAAEMGLYHLITARLISSLTGSLISVIPPQQVALPMLVAFMGTSVFVGVFGGVNAIRNYLKV